MKLKIPEFIGRIKELANNLWLDTYTEAREAFGTPNYQVWKINEHNPSVF